MGCECNNNGVIGRSRILCATVSFLFLLILASTQMRFMAEGRSISTSKSDKTVSEDKVLLRGQIGSRPPKCERRCSWCGHCEAIQVPANPQKSATSKNSSTMKNIAYARDEASNYKPMSWKCKCGSLIFNP